TVGRHGADQGDFDVGSGEVERAAAFGPADDGPAEGVVVTEEGGGAGDVTANEQGSNKCAADDLVAYLDRRHNVEREAIRATDFGQCRDRSGAVSPHGEIGPHPQLRQRVLGLDLTDELLWPEH